MSRLSAAILAGGRGTRLSSVVMDRPKVLADVRGRPFLTYLLDQAAAAGLREVVLCTGYLGEQIPRLLGETYGPLRLRYSHESSPMGTAGALVLARPQLGADTVLVMNGDSFCDVDPQALQAWHDARGSQATLALVHAPEAARYGRVSCDAQGRVIRFEEKQPPGGPGWINAGMYLLTRAFLDRIPEGRAVSLETELFPAWVGQGLYGCPSEGRFLDIGTPDSYAAAERFFEVAAST